MKKIYVIAPAVFVGLLLAAIYVFGGAMRSVEATPSPTPTFTQYSATPSPVYVPTPVPVPGPTKTVTAVPKPAPTETKIVKQTKTVYKATDDCKQAMKEALHALDAAWRGFDNADRYSELISNEGYTDIEDLRNAEIAISDRQSEIYQKFYDNAQSFDDWRERCK